MLIRTKKQYYDLAKRGQAGNSPQIWATAEEFLTQSSDKEVGLRMLSPGSKGFRAFIPRSRITKEVSLMGLREGEYVLSKTIGPEEIKIAGELSWIDGQWVFYYSFVKKPMREALAKEGRYIYGLDVWSLLKVYGTQKDIEELHDLFERYTYLNNHPVIELTVTHNDCGLFQNRNILIWEVRHY